MEARWWASGCCVRIINGQYCANSGRGGRRVGGLAAESCAGRREGTGETGREWKELRTLLEECDSWAWHRASLRGRRRRRETRKGRPEAWPVAMGREERAREAAGSRGRAERPWASSRLVAARWDFWSGLALCPAGAVSGSRPVEVRARARARERAGARAARHSQARPAALVQERRWGMLRALGQVLVRAFVRSPWVPRHAVRAGQVDGPGRLVISCLRPRQQRGQWGGGTRKTADGQCNML